MIMESKKKGKYSITTNLKILTIDAPDPLQFRNKKEASSLKLKRKAKDFFNFLSPINKKKFSIFTYHPLKPINKTWKNNWIIIIIYIFIFVHKIKKFTLKYRSSNLKKVHYKLISDSSFIINGQKKEKIESDFNFPLAKNNLIKDEKIKSFF